MGLEQNPSVPLIGMVTRLADHKGLDLVQWAFSSLMERPVQFVLLGSGEGQLEQFFRDAAGRYPGRAGIYIGFNEALARRIYSGADLFLMPSRSEPCGLAQMIAMRYGTIPIVRSTGGLRDSVRDFGGENGNGYTFLTYQADDMLDAILRACRDYANPPLWVEHCRAAMSCDFGWGRSAAEYISLYRNLLSM